jgi:hypothetical protein
MFIRFSDYEEIANFDLNFSLTHSQCSETFFAHGIPKFSNGLWGRTKNFTLLKWGTKQ